jgi:repressor LexA
MLPLSKKQLKVLGTLEDFSEKEGRMPSVRELASILGLSCSTTHQHLSALEKKGVILRDGTAHGILMPSSRDAEDSGSSMKESPSFDDFSASIVSVPLVGTIAAGCPIEAIETPDEPVLLSSHIVSDDCYALRVSGDSMINAHILDGDIVIIRPQQRVEQGEIAVALLSDGSATLKRIYVEKNRVRLQPENDELEAFYVEEVTIQGKVVALVREAL